jgi:hypothetical protein
VTDLLELAARVEAADGPSQDLNLAIWRAVNPNGYAIWEGQQRGLLNKQWDEERRQVTLKARARVEAKPFTTSLDAAMQLYVTLPERVPSDPRQAVVEALRQRAEAANASA